MPNAPNVDGLPLWLQIFVSLVFGAATLAVGISGYLARKSGGKTDEHQTARLLGATIADMGALRRLSDSCVQLDGHIITLSNQIGRLDDTLQDQIHWDRDRNELMREISQRLRELKERLDRK